MHLSPPLSSRPRSPPPQIRGKKVFKLPDLWMRPAFPGKGRKAPGILEAHHNGFRCARVPARPHTDVSSALYAVVHPRRSVDALRCTVVHACMVRRRAR